MFGHSAFDKYFFAGVDHRENRNISLGIPNNLEMAGNESV